MKKIILSKCLLCGKELTSRGFSFHVSKTHNIAIEDYIVEHIYSGNPPKCMCGCGGDVTIRMYCVMDYIDHHSEAGRFNSDSVKNRNREEWLIKTTAGIRKYNREQKEKDPDYRSGQKSNSFGVKHSEETKNKIRLAVKDQILSGRHPFIGNNNGRIRGSKLEDTFGIFLSELGVSFEHNFKLEFDNDGVPGYKYYDFYINGTNRLIEVHGNYWHPRKNENLNSIQKKNLENDIFKKELAEKSGYKIFYVYEDELDTFVTMDIDDFFYFIQAERKDIDKLVVEYGG